MASSFSEPMPHATSATAAGYRAEQRGGTERACCGSAASRRARHPWAEAALQQGRQPAESSRPWAIRTLKRGTLREGVDGGDDKVMDGGRGDQKRGDDAKRGAGVLLQGEAVMRKSGKEEKKDGKTDRKTGKRQFARTLAIMIFLFPFFFPLQDGTRTYAIWTQCLQNREPRPSGCCHA